MERITENISGTPNAAYGAPRRDDNCPATALLDQASRVQRRVSILSFIGASGVALILIHQGFTFFSRPVSEPLELTHLALLLLAFKGMCLKGAFRVGPETSSYCTR